MKKILITLSIILALSLIFVACNKNTNENETEDTTNVPTEITTTTATEDTESDTEVTTESSEETSTKADESTSEEETTTEEHTTENTNEFLELMSRVDQAMAEVEFFRITETSDTIADGVSIVTYERTTRFDGYYANITDCTDNKIMCEMYIVDNLFVYSDLFSDDIVTCLSESEFQYVLDELVFKTIHSEKGKYINMLDSFNNAVIREIDNGGYELQLSSPTNTFLQSLTEEADDGTEILDITYLVKLNSDYTESAVISETTVSIMGKENSIITTTEFNYEEFYLDNEVKDNFDGYKVVGFDYIFGYIDTSYGKDLGLDIESDNFVLDYRNEEFLEHQIDFMNTFIDDFLGKTFTIYGNIYQNDSEYSIEVGNGYMYFNIALADGVEYLEGGTLASVTGKLCVEISDDYGEELPIYYLEISNASAITEDDIPEGGYLPWTAYVTAKSLNVRSSADFSSGANNKVGVLSQNTEVKVVGFIPDRYCMIEYHWETADGQSGEYAFVSLAYLSKLPTYYITLDENYKPANPPV